MILAATVLENVDPVLAAIVTVLGIFDARWKRKVDRELAELFAIVGRARGRRKRSR